MIDAYGCVRQRYCQCAELLKTGAESHTVALPQPWMMVSELFQKRLEAGIWKAEAGIFFDEAHLLFADAPKMLVQKIEQVVKLDPFKGRGYLFRDSRGRTLRRSRKLSGQQHSPCGPILPLRQKKSSWNWA